MADRTVVYRLQADIAKFRAQMAQAGASTKKLADDLTGIDKNAAKSRRGLETFGSAAGKIGLVAAGGLGAAVVAAANFDAKMSEIKAASGETTENMQKLREAAIQAGADTAFSAGEAADGITELSKAGVATADILGGGLTGALDLAAAGQIDVGEAAEYSAKAMTQFSLAGDQVPHVADLLAAAAGKAVGEVGDFGQALNQTGLVAAQTGLTIEDTVGTLAAFAQAGLQGSDAGTSFKSMLQRLQNPLGKGAEALETYGISAYDAQGNFVGITEVASQLQDQLGGLDQATRDAALSQIFGSDAVRAATVLYREGGDGIQHWIDQTNDAGFASEQAATKLDNLKGDLEALKGSLETALIGTGDGAQGPLRQLTQGLTSVVNAYNDLPGAAKTATGAMLAGGAALGGSIWVGTKLIRGIADTREALDNLGISGARASGAMKKLGVAAGGLAALTVAAAGVRAIGDALQENLPGIEATTAALLGLSEAAESGFSAKGLGAEFESLGESIDRLTDKSLQQKFADTMQTPFEGLFGEAASLEEARAELNAVDEALASIVQSGNADAAASALEQLTDHYGLTAEQTKALTRLLPQYDEALIGQANDAKLAAAATEEQAAATEGLGAEALAAQERIKKLNKAIRESRNAAKDTAREFAGVSAAVETGKQSLNDFIRNMEKNAQALRDFRVNAEKAAKKGLREGLIAELQAMGPEGARQMEKLANATDSEIKRANKAWESGQREIRKYTNEVGGVPKSVSTDVNVNANGALNIIDLVERQMRYLDGLRATTYIDTVRRGRVSGGVQEYAEGGAVSGPGTATSDSIPAYLSNGEFVMKAAAVARYGTDFMHQINAMRFAEGGLAQRYAMPARSTVSVGSPNVNVGGAQVRVFIDGQEIRHLVQSEQAADRRFVGRLADRD